MMFKKYREVLIFVILIVGVTALCVKYGPKNPDYEVLRPARDIQVDSLSVNNETIFQGDKLEIESEIFNASSQSQNTISSIYVIEDGKIYDGTNADFISNKQIVNMNPKSTAILKWQIPLYYPAGKYRFMIGLHSYNNEIDKYVEDFWYKSPIVLKDRDKSGATEADLTIYGESSGQKISTLITDSFMTPALIKSGDELSANFEVRNGLESKKIVAGAYVIGSDKTYNSHNQDYSFPPQTNIINQNHSRNFSWKEPMTLKPGFYKVLYWIHYINDAGQETWIQDYWLPGYLEVSG